MGGACLPCFRFVFQLEFGNSYVFFYDLPFLSSIHEKANCIAMFWTVSPHSLGSCHFRVTCLPHKDGASR